MMMNTQRLQLQLQLPLSFSRQSSYSTLSPRKTHLRLSPINAILCFHVATLHRQRPIFHVQATSFNDGTTATTFDDGDEEEYDDDDDELEPEPTADDLEHISQIKRVLEVLKKNRDMLFSEVKLTVMIEDLREVERRRLLGLDDPDTPTREDLGEALEEVNQGKIPRNRRALQMLAEEMINWPSLEVTPKKTTKRKSLYAKVTDTGIDPEVAAKRLNVDWDSAADIEEETTSDESDVPPIVGYGALYLVSAFPVIIGISVVLILFYNSLS